MTTQIKQRRDTAANWASNNPVLGVGELGWETDTRKGKLGNGATAWNALLYIVAPDSSALTSATSFAGDVSGLYNALVVAKASGSFQLTADATITTTGTLDDYALAGTTAVLRWNGASGLTFSGMQGGADGRIVFIQNVQGVQSLVLVHDATSSAANRFFCPGATNLTVRAHHSVIVVYDATDSRWRVLGDSDLRTDAVWSAKGDLLVATGDNAAALVSVGTNDQVLTADSAQASGVKWATPAAGGGGSATFAGTWRYGGM